MVEQTPFNWVKVARLGKLKGADIKLVSADQMEVSRLRAELARVKMQRDILGKEGRKAKHPGNAWPGERVLRESTELKYALINRHCRVWPTSVQCRFLEASVAGITGTSCALPVQLSDATWATTHR